MNSSVYGKTVGDLSCLYGWYGVDDHFKLYFTSCSFAKKSKLKIFVYYKIEILSK